MGKDKKGKKEKQGMDLFWEKRSVRQSVTTDELDHYNRLLHTRNSRLENKIRELQETIDACQAENCCAKTETKEEVNNMSNADAYQIDGDHYNENKIQPWTAMQAWDDDQAEHFIGYLRFNALKYIQRMGKKRKENESRTKAMLRDAQKGHHYLMKLVEQLSNRHAFEVMQTEKYLNRDSIVQDLVPIGETEEEENNDGE